MAGIVPDNTNPVNDSYCICSDIIGNTKNYEEENYVIRTKQ
jgi:hypothetical protein